MGSPPASAAELGSFLLPGGLPWRLGVCLACFCAVGGGQTLHACMHAWDALHMGNLDQCRPTFLSSCQTCWCHNTAGTCHEALGLVWVCLCGQKMAFPLLWHAWSSDGWQVLIQPPHHQFQAIISAATCFLALFRGSAFLLGRPQWWQMALSHSMPGRQLLSVCATCPAPLPQFEDF